MEPGRIWYVGITGSWKEDAHWDENIGKDDDTLPSSERAAYGLSAEEDGVKRGEYGPWGGFYAMRGVNYKLEVIDEFGGLTSPPTTMPTFGDTPVYLPSEFISDPVKAGYENFLITCVLLFGAAATAFVLTRCFFNAVEKRSTARWVF